MKKIMVIFLITVLVCSGLTGCAGQSTPAAGAAAPVSGGIALADIRRAAEEAGYKVTDEYQSMFMKEVVGGFSVEVVADGQDVIYTVMECKTEEATISNAKTIDDAGYSIALRKGKLLTCYGVDLKEGTTKDILASILDGKPVKNSAQ